MEAFWSIALIVGPLLLLGVIIYAWTRNRKQSKRAEHRADRGARRLREEIEEEPDKPVDL